eukprot:UN03506
MGHNSFVTTKWGSGFKCCATEYYDKKLTEEQKRKHAPLIQAAKIFQTEADKQANLTDSSDAMSDSKLVKHISEVINISRC